MTILTALFSALVAAGAFIKIPMFPVPMTLQTLFVFLSGLLLPPVASFSSLLIYIVLGAVGLPIFTSGGGLAALLGPTGGFIFGFLLSAPVGSLLAKKKRDSVWWNLFVLLVMEVLMYVVGIVWLKIKLDATWAKAFSVGLVPFIVGDAVKIAVAAVAGKILYPETQRLMEKLKRREEDK
ncbi:MAG: biotin transporter BioY [Candidatus Ornithospirochaeta sp.]